MKKRKILYLFPLAALVLSGCTFQEGWETAKTWMSDHIFTPIANLFNGGSKDSGKKPSGGNTPAPSTDSDTEEVVATEVGSVDNPLTVSQFQTLCDENLGSAYDGIEDKKSVTDFAHIAYLKAKVSSNTWNSDGTKIQYLNLVDQTNSTLQVTGMFVVVDQSVTGDYSAKDSLKGLEVVVKGYPALYKKSGAKTYELVSKDKSDSENPRLMKVFAPEPTPGLNYGTLDNPLTVSQAKALIDTENPTAVKAYVIGEVKSNEAYNASYKNVMRITITDGQNDIVIFKCGTFPEGFDGTAITANSLKGMTALAYGIGELYQSTTYELTAPSIISFSGEVTPPTPVDNFGTLDNPLSIAEAKAVIDAQNPTTQEMYVTGTVKSNTAWSTQYNNVDIVLTDGQGNEFTVWRTATFPEGVEKENIKKDSLKDKVVVAHGTGKLYNTTYELDQGCVVDKIEDAAPIEVQYVQLSQQSIEMEVGQHVDLNAYVFPNNASQDVEWSIQQTGEVVSFENNVISGLAVGTATITATSVADPTKSASCTVTVSEATKTLTGITVDTTNAKHNYEEGDDYSAEGLVVTAHYSDAPDEQVVAGVTWEFDPVKATLGDESVTITAHYNEESSINVISVTVSEKVAEKGTLENPYSVSEAYVIYQGLASGADNGKSVYVEGYIDANPAPSIGSNRGNFYLTDGVCAVDAYAYGINNVGNTQDVTLADIPVGGRALVQCAIKNYGGTFELCFVSNVSNGCLAKAVETPVLTSVGQPVGPAEVSVGGSIDPSQVTVPVVYSNIVNAEIHPTSVSGDFSTAGKATVTVVVDGWEDTVSFDVTVVSGTVLVETEVYKLDGTITATGNAYATPTTLTQGGVSWDVTANTEMNPWRIGGKGLTNQNRSVQSNGVVATDDVTKVAVDIGATASGLTLNSVTLNVGKTVGASDVSTETKTSNITNTVVEFERPANTDWSSCYFTVVFNVTRTSTSGNGYVTLKAISFYAMK